MLSSLMKNSAPTDLATANDLISESGPFSKLCSPQTYIDAFNHCRKNAIWKSSVQRFEKDKLALCVKLANDIKNSTYQPDPYREFNICERGKRRHIKAPTIRDRVFTHALCHEILNPIILPHLIYDNSAAIKGRGVSFARKRILVHLHSFYRKHGNNGYILQTDFSRFFESIDHALLYQTFCKYVHDQRILAILKRIIFSFKGNTGVGIGSELSQIAGILYPSPIDHYCKTVKRCHFYARYMDDIYIIHESKEFLKTLFVALKAYASKLKLLFNPRKYRISKLSANFTFLKTNYHLSNTGKVFYKPCKNTLIREHRKLKNMQVKYHAGIISLELIKSAYKSWRGSIARQYPQAIKHTIKYFDNYFLKLYGVEP